MQRVVALCCIAYCASHCRCLQQNVLCPSLGGSLADCSSHSDGSPHAVQGSCLDWTPGFYAAIHMPTATVLSMSCCQATQLASTPSLYMHGMAVQEAHQMPKPGSNAETVSGCPAGLANISVPANSTHSSSPLLPLSPRGQYPSRHSGPPSRAVSPPPCNEVDDCSCLHCPQCLLQAQCAMLLLCCDAYAICSAQ